MIKLQANIRTAASIIAGVEALRPRAAPALAMTQVAVDQFVSRPAPLLVQRANSPAELLRCRQLLYSAYETKGYLQSDPVTAKAAGTFHADQSHASPAARRRGQTFFIDDSSGTIVATGSLIRDTPKHVSPLAKNYGLPLDKSVPQELAALRAELPDDAKIAEIGGLAAVGETRGPTSVKILRALRNGEGDSQPVTALFGAMHRHAVNQGVTDLVMGVHPTHARFYERLGFSERPPLAGGDRAGYSGLRNAEVVLLHGRIDQLQLSLNRG